MNALNCRTLGATLMRILENARAIETLTTACANVKAHALLKRTLMTCNGNTLVKRRTIKKKKLAALHRVVFQVVFSLLLAFLGPLEGSAVEKVHGMTQQYPRRMSWGANDAPTERFQRKPHKFFDLRCPLNM